MSLKKLIKLCNASVNIAINEHKSVYSSIAHTIADLEKEDRDEIDYDVLQKMIDLDTMVNVHFYPQTPIGFYSIYHYDVDLAIEQAINIAEEYGVENDN